MRDEIQALIDKRPSSVLLTPEFNQWLADFGASCYCAGMKEGAETACRALQLGVRAAYADAQKAAA